MVLICSCLVFSSSGSRGHFLSGAPVKHYNHYLRTTYGLTQYNCQILLSQSTFVGSTPMQIRLCKHLGVMQCSGKILCTLNLFFFSKAPILLTLYCAAIILLSKRGEKTILYEVEMPLLLWVTYRGCSRKAISICLLRQQEASCLTERRPFLRLLSSASLRVFAHHFRKVAHTLHNSGSVSVRATSNNGIACAVMF